MVERITRKETALNDHFCVNPVSYTHLDVYKRQVEQYGVYWVELDPTRGGEMAKTRPCVCLLYTSRCV